MATKTEPVAQEGAASRLQSISEQLQDAEKAVADAEQAQEAVSGLSLLGEVDDTEVRTAEEALSEANRHLAALVSAKKVLVGREAAQVEAESAAQVDRWRKESDVAAKSQSAALSKVEQHARALAASLAVIEAQSNVLTALHNQLSAASPQQASEIQQDYRDALALIGTTYAQKRGDIKNAAGSANYRLQASSDGVDRVLEGDLALLGDAVIAAGSKYSAGRSQVLAWEVSALAQCDQELHEAQQEAWEDFAARTEIGGLGSLPASRAEVQSAAALDIDALALLLPDQTARDLIGLTSWLPASANEATSARTITRDPLLARQNEARLQAGLSALRSLAGR